MTLVGRHVNEQEPIFDYFPAYQDLTTPEKGAITIEHLLTMTSGLQWNEWELPLSDTRNDLIQLWIVEDPVATGQRMDHYATEQLLTPLGITEFVWDSIDDDTVHASGNLRLRPRDMAKLGYLIRNHGRWQERQIVPEEWVEQTTASYINTPTPDQGSAYGYQWWHMSSPGEAGPVEALHRSGWGGQELYLFPGLDMLVALTGGSYVGEPPSNDIIANHIIPAARALQVP